MSFMPDPGTRVRLRDDREATVTKICPDGSDDRVRFDDGHEEPVDAWAIAEVLTEAPTVLIDDRSNPGSVFPPDLMEWDCRRCACGVIVNGLLVTAQRMFLCPTCGNKRCPKATDHELRCTGSNEPGQPGSDY